MPQTGVLARPEYPVWSAMIQRCTNPKSPGFKNYGAKSITICPRWRTSFHAFVEDMGPRPSIAYSLERTNNAMGYFPANCRWATRTEQNRNRSNCIELTIDGRTQLMTDWAKERGVHVSMICRRLQRGWSASRAVMTPPTPGAGAARVRSSVAPTTSTSTSRTSDR